MNEFKQMQVEMRAMMSGSKSPEKGLVTPSAAHNGSIKLKQADGGQRTTPGKGYIDRESLGGQADNT